MARPKTRPRVIPPAKKPAPRTSNDRKRTFPIVGVGASAGGLAAFTQLLRGLPERPGFPLVYVQHLSPNHASALPELFSAATRMPVVKAADRQRLQPDTVYVLPPNTQVTVEEGVLQVSARPEGPTKYTPIDIFFRSLAQADENAVAVLLSGSSQDGVAGLRDVKVGGGTTIVQSPDTAEFDVMPRAAIAAGVADLVVSPDSMGPTLIRLVQSPFIRRGRISDSENLSFQEHHLKRVFGILRNATSVDFSHYKEPTIRRRLLRRMLLNRRADIDQYISQLEEQPLEVQNLYHDLLIQVTRFFREPESFAALRDKVFPVILKERRPDQPIRIWIPGCSSGEEAYSVAIELLEFLGDNAGDIPIQVFATDVSDRAVERARAGRFPESITEDVSPQRLRRFFTKADGAYLVSKAVRDICVFARQDLTRDPPFSKLDLIVCRNVLIYLDPFVHRKLMTIFQYALKPDRFLMLGRAEAIGGQGDLFQMMDKKFRIYRRKTSVARMDLDYYPQEQPHRASQAPEKTGRARREPGGVQGEAMRLLLNKYAPPAVIVDNDLRIVHARGQTGPYLELAPGDASLNLLKMTREGLLYGLRAAINEARKAGTPVRKSGLRVKTNGKVHTVSVEVTPISGVSAAERHFLVLFESGASRDGDAHPLVETPGKRSGRGKQPPAGKARRPGDGEARVSQLQQELAANREYLQSIIQDLEATNEELQSANEEILSSNEELQSTNEELDTAKEELQSTNEEINTVNEELQARNEELSRANSDLLNLLAGVQIAIVFLTNDLRIRRFTPMAEKVLNLIPSDVGRPIGNIRPNIDCPELEQLITEVVDTVSTKEREVQDREGHWMLLRVRPYKSLENRIEGAVLVLLDIDAIRRQEERLRTVEEYSNSLLELVDQPMAVLDGDLRVASTNQAFLRMFAPDGRDLSGKRLPEVGDGHLGGADLERLVRQALGTDGGRPPELIREFPGLGRKRLGINAHRVIAADGRNQAIVLAVREAPPGGA